MFGSKPLSKVKVENLNKKFGQYQNTFNRMFNKKAQKMQTSFDKVTYVLHFTGDVYASQVQKFRDEVTSIIFSQAKETYKGTALVKLDSPGGTVTGYGLLAEQIKRLRAHGFYVVVAVDQVAASGGYMAAVCADKIIAAPSAVIGSIGVVAQVPNYKELLDKIGVKYKDYTAGKFKRTVTPYSDPTPEAEEHFTQSLERVHKEFKEHIKENRPDVDVEAIGTGEHWSAREALDLGLIDHLGVYDEVLLQCINESLVLYVYHDKPKKGLFGGTKSMAEMVIDKVVERVEHHIVKRLHQDDFNNIR
ncbi:protease [Vibrio phage Va1]|nr:protease [Vibrio phage Va1]